MKRITFLVTAMLFTGLISFAGEHAHDDHGKRKGLSTRYRFAQPVQFVERGVEFFVFPNGELDFNAISSGNYYKRYPHANRTVNKYRGKYRTQRVIRPRVSYDNFGRVVRVGRSYIDYNRYGQIKRIGDIFIRYDHRGLVNQVGGMRVKYNPAGKLIRSNGRVNQLNNWCSCDTYECNMNHNHRTYYNDDDDDDDDWEYERKRKRNKY